MLFPIIKVKDNHKGYEHIVGTDSHDMLGIDDGQIFYYNLQNGDGSIHGGSYEFIGVEDEMLDVTVEFVTFDELKTIYENENKLAAEIEMNMKIQIKRILDERKK